MPGLKFHTAGIRQKYDYNSDRYTFKQSLQRLPENQYVLYLALIAFWAECCRFVIGSADVCYTENLANPSAQDFTPHPAQ
jgi:hypothetical protein